MIGPAKSLWAGCFGLGFFQPQTTTINSDHLNQVILYIQIIISSSVFLKDVKESKVTGNTTVKEGDTLNLTCSVESFPPSHVWWTSSKNLQIGTESDQQNNPGTATLVIPNVKAEHTGQYICKSKQLNTTKIMHHTNVTVTCKLTSELTGSI